jgi:hypothetical protein
MGKEGEEDRSESGIVTLLASLAARNDQYHTAKETLFWLSSSAYLAFSIAVIKWLVDLPSCHSLWDHKGAIVVFLAIVFLFAEFFIIRQNRLKAESAWLNGKYTELIGKLDEAKYRTYTAIEQYANKRPDMGIRFYLDFGRPGLWVVIVTSIFFIAQVWLVITESGRGLGKMDLLKEPFQLWLIAVFVCGIGVGLLLAFLARVIIRSDKSIDKMRENIEDLRREVQKLNKQKT